MCKLVYSSSGGGFSLPIYAVIAQPAALNYSLSTELLGLASLEIVCHGLRKTRIGYCSLMKSGYLFTVKTDVGKCYEDEENVVVGEEITPYGGGSVKFWAGINSLDRTELVFIENGRMTRHQYIIKVLIQHAQPSLAALGKNSTFIDEHSRLLVS